MFFSLDKINLTQQDGLQNQLDFSEGDISAVRDDLKHSFGFLGIDCLAKVLPSWIPWAENFMWQLRDLISSYDTKIADRINISSLRLKEFTPYDLNLLINNRIVYDNQQWSYLPPCLYWLSPTGRFACIEIGEALDLGNFFLLWDLSNDELMQLAFHDLEGVNEEQGVIYGRTHSDICPWESNFPMRINLSSINSDLDWVPLSPEKSTDTIYFVESEYIASRMFRITREKDEYDLANKNAGLHLLNLE